MPKAAASMTKSVSPEPWSVEPPIQPRLVLPKVKRISLTKSSRPPICSNESSRAGRNQVTGLKPRPIPSHKIPLKRPSSSDITVRRSTPDYPSFEGPDYDGPGE